MEYLKSSITKKEAKLVIAEFRHILKDAARKAKNVQSKDYLNQIADGLIPLEKIADQRTQAKK